MSFGLNIGLFCYSLDGTLLWKRTWPPQPIYLDFGTGSSPIAHAGRVYLLQDSERESFLAALDAKTGADVWRVPRTEKSTSTARRRGRRRSSGRTRYGPRSSPPVTASSRATASTAGSSGASRASRCRSTSPVTAGDLLFVGTGAQEGDAARPFFAINAGASGDITLTGEATSNAFVRWTHPRASGYTPSPLVHQGRVYLVHDLGTMLVLSADTGKEIYRARVGGLGHTFSASPIATANRIYFPDEEGVTIVLDAGDSYREIAQNDLGAMTLASPAVAGNALFIRTDSKLYRIE